MSTACQKFVEGSKHSVSWAFGEYLKMNDVPNDPWYKAIGKSAALIVTIPIAVIEGVVRGILGLLATPIILLLPEGKARNWYNEHIFSPLAIGSLKSFSMCPMAIMYTAMGIGLLFGQLKDACTTSPEGNIAKMPPNIWCCCKRTTSA